MTTNTQSNNIPIEYEIKQAVDGLERIRDRCSVKSWEGSTANTALRVIERLRAEIASHPAAEQERQSILDAALEESREALASRLIDAWCDAHKKQIPWAKAIEIIAIVTKMPDDEKTRLLSLDDAALSASQPKEGKAS